jgi:hypothetical protein
MSAMMMQLAGMMLAHCDAKRQSRRDTTPEIRLLLLFHHGL